MSDNDMTPEDYEWAAMGPENYRDYVNRATEEGYPLRYFRVRRRVPAVPMMGFAILILVLLIKGCDRIHASAPAFSYVLLVILATFLFLVIFLAIAYIAKTKKIGYLDFTEDALVFLEPDLEESRRIPIADLTSIWNRHDVDSQLQGMTSRGRFLKLALEFRDGTIVNVECANTPFFPERHDQMYIPAGFLLEELNGIGKKA